MIAGIKAGLTLKLACERVSITTVTLHSWEVRGRKEQERPAAGGDCWADISQRGNRVGRCEPCQAAGSHKVGLCAG